jgi:hypothetical protein
MRRCSGNFLGHVRISTLPSEISRTPSTRTKLRSFLMAFLCHSRGGGNPIALKHKFFGRSLCLKKLNLLILFLTFKNEYDTTYSALEKRRKVYPHCFRQKGLYYSAIAVFLGFVQPDSRLRGNDHAKPYCLPDRKIVEPLLRLCQAEAPARFLITEPLWPKGGFATSQGATWLGFAHAYPCPNGLNLYAAFFPKEFPRLAPLAAHGQSPVLRSLW